MRSHRQLLCCHAVSEVRPVHAIFVRLPARAPWEIPLP